MPTDTKKSHMILYRDSNNAVKIDVRFENENVWLTQVSKLRFFFY